MENVEIIEQPEEPEPIAILDPDQEELGEQNAEKLENHKFHMFTIIRRIYVTN
jgi:hypothetical protein